MTIFLGKFFTFAGHENWVSYLNSQGAQYHRIESTFGATKSHLTSYLIAEKQPSRYL